MSSVPVIKRSVLVNGVSAEVGPDVLKEFFGNVGETTSVSSLSYDPVSNTRQYQVTFASPDSLPSALHLSGLMLINKIITIVPADPTAPLPVQQQQQQQQPPSEFGSAAVNSNGGLQGEVALLPPQGPVIPGIVMQSMMSMGPVVPDNNGIEYVDGHRVAVFLAPGHIVAEKNKALSGSSNSSSGEPGKEKSAVAMNPDAALIAEKREQVAKTVYVGNVKRSVSAEQLSAFFSGCGMVTYVCFRGDEIPGPVHYGFVEFDSVEAAQKAMSVSGAFLEGFPIK